MAITKAKSEIKFNVIPNADIIANVPINDTGTAMVGINVERQSPKKRNTTIATKINASNNV
ncbi:hypothetical protein D3C72_2485610 [compost metagenome]